MLRRSACTTLAALACACGEPGTNAGLQWQGHADTLPTGAIRIRNPASGMWRPDERWQFVEELRIGKADAEGPEQFSRVTAVAASPSGHILIADGSAQQIRAFDRTGTYIRSFGRPGSGPAEFRSISGMAWDSMGRLWVADPGNARYALYDSTGVHKGDRPMRTPGTILPWLGGLGQDGFLYDAAVRGGPEGDLRFSYFRADTSSGELLDSLPSFGRPPQSTGYPAPLFALMPRLTFRFDPKGYIWFGVTSEYRIVQQALDGDTVRIVERPMLPPVVSEAEKDSVMQALGLIPQDPRGSVGRRDIPDTKPVFDRIYLDGSGHMIVQINGGPHEQGRRFDVFDPDGRFLGTATSDVAFTSFPAPPVFTNHFVYGVTTDSLGIHYVVRARIQRGESDGVRSP